MEILSLTYPSSCNHKRWNVPGSSWNLQVDFNTSQLPDRGEHRSSASPGEVSQGQVPQPFGV
jgi:hypothetical protein